MREQSPNEHSFSFPSRVFRLEKGRENSSAHRVSWDPTVPDRAARLWDGSCDTQWGT